MLAEVDERETQDGRIAPGRRAHPPIPLRGHEGDHRRAGGMLRRGRGPRVPLVVVPLVLFRNKRQALAGVDGDPPNPREALGLARPPRRSGGERAEDDPGDVEGCAYKRGGAREMSPMTAEDPGQDRMALERPGEVEAAQQSVGAGAASRLRPQDL